MTELAGGFKDALNNIEPDKDDKTVAAGAHTALRTHLEADDDLANWGINPVLIGSYARQVSIRRVKDVDMFCRLDDLPSSVTAQTLLDHFYERLADAYGEGAVTAQARSVKVEIPDSDGLYVDAVPARPDGDEWQIPKKGGGWQNTNPEEITALKTAMNAEHDDRYVKMVKLLRQSRRNLLGDAKPGGLAIEMALYTAFKEGIVSGTSHASYFASSLEGVANVLRRVADEGFDIPDPSRLGEVFTFRGTASDWSTAASEFESAAEDARTAYDMNDDSKGKAAVLIQGILGSNDDFPQVFPMSAGYNEDGTPKAESKDWGSGSVTVAGGSGRFG
jgi:hypothetical protein